MSRRGSVWGMPVALGALTAVGLTAGLLGDGAWDAAAVVSLAAPVAVGAWYALRPLRQRVLRRTMY